MPITTRMVDTDNIIDEAVTTEKIAALAIIAEKIAAGSIITEKLAALAIIAEKIAVGAIEAEKIATGAITTEKLAALAITAEKIAALTITASQIAANAIIASKILVDYLSAINVNLGEITAGSLTSVIIQSKLTPPRVRMDESGLYYQVTTAIGKYGTFKYGDGTKYGAGVVAFFCNSNYPPFAIMALQNIADLRLFNRVADPLAGKHQIGDIICVAGKLKICTTAGEPGTFSIVGTQS